MSKFSEGITALGVRRPVLITVFNLLIMLAGFASFFGIDIRELPDVDRPIISVRAVYDGASPGTMDTEVTSILEGAVSRVSGVKSIESSSEENNMRMRVEFDSSVDLNVAASDVREAVSRAQRQLPDNIDQVLVIKADSDADSVVQLSAYSDTLLKYELAERIEKDVAPEFLSIKGVADVMLNGDQPRVLRVLLDPALLAGYKLSVSDAVDTLRTINLDVPAGSYESDDQELLVRAQATVVKPEKVEELYIRGDIQIGDVGEVFYAPMEAESYSLLNGRMVVGLGIIRQAGSNTIDIANEVDRRLKEINERSKDFTLVKTSDDAIFIKGALKDVVFTLIFSILIVLLIIGVFLGQAKAVLIPAVTMPISLIGTLAAIWLFGFSVNLLTLLALVLATGLIVDDAIVVLENIQRVRSEGMEKMAAAVIGTKQVFFAVIATTITLVSVFLPIAFLPGDTGRMFKEFGLVLTIAVIISSFVAVTLCPMMTSRLPNLSKSNKFLDAIRGKLDRFGHRSAGFYFRTLNSLIHHKIISLIIAVGVAIGGMFSFFLLNQELLPKEDRGSIQVLLTGPDGSSLSYADRQSQKVEEVLFHYQEQGIVTDIFTIVGRWDKNRAYTIATLKHWDERDVSQMELASEINDKLKDMPGALVRVIQRGSLNIRGGGRGIQIALTGNNYDDLYTESTDFAQKLKENIPIIEDVNIQFDTSQPELSFNINRQRANDLKVPMERISQTLRVMVDKLDLLDLSVNDQAVPVMVGSANGVINDPGDLLNIFVTNTNDELVPLSSLIDVKESGVAAELDRHAQRRAIELDIGLPPATTIGDVLEDIKNLAKTELPQGTNLLLLGESATLEESSYETALTFLIALLVVFLVLSAQFESIGSAAIVMFTVPFGLAAAVFALLLTGQSLNLYSQIGLVMLIGLMTKNAILLVEFMDQMRDEGMSVEDAVMEGVRVRLRPVIMTVSSTVIGSLPLILFTGPGAEARNSIGWVVFGGLGLSTLFTLYLAPLGYSIIAPFVKPRASSGKELEKQLKNAKRNKKEVTN
ncbi:MAG: efflux RND transporter permease subunit [Rickettsiales bacterium]|nr:efflux RND transporter permease subunit [Pseudomonadota bacterium]MDA0967394.1 efflux RND transporter permease subunit [Pseudomonadota bacterium]MDG4544417.1 efflux RND transporter permease subunit [Rickettsiales bacterium]MDG4546547.1 efflux RND transporter permease subunit [Rickettsiales bacterium]